MTGDFRRAPLASTRHAGNTLLGWVAGARARRRAIGLRPGAPAREWARPVNGSVRSRPVSRVLSRTVIPLGRTSPFGSSDLPGCDAGSAIAPLFGLAPSGVCRAVRRWPRTRCALTAPFHPYHAPLARPFGGLFSVALSVGSRRPGVTWHSALWSPDFPPRRKRRSDCPADSARHCSLRPARETAGTSVDAPPHARIDGYPAS